MEKLRDSAASRAAFSGDPLLLCAGAATDPNFRSQRLAERVCGLVSHTLVSERGRAALIADTWKHRGNCALPKTRTWLARPRTARVGTGCY